MKQVGMDTLKASGVWVSKHLQKKVFGRLGIDVCSMFSTYENAYR